MNVPVALHVDPRLALLAQASAAHTLVTAGEIDLDDVFADLVEPFLDALAVDDNRILYVNEERMVARWEQKYPHVREVHLKPRRAAQSTFDAVCWELREYGVGRLADSECQRRLNELSPSQYDDLIASLRRAQPPVSEDLLSSLETMSCG